MYSLATINAANNRAVKQRQQALAAAACPEQGKRDEEFAEVASRSNRQPSVDELPHGGFRLTSGALEVKLDGEKAEEFRPFFDKAKARSRAAVTKLVEAVFFARSCGLDWKQLA
jgi:hypothetical protein